MTAGRVTNTPIYLSDGRSGPAVSAYSHGKQKLALISHSCTTQLMILDEPFVGLDRCLHKLKGSCAKSATRAAPSFSTLLEVAEKLCDKVAIIRNSRLVVSERWTRSKATRRWNSCFWSWRRRNDRKLIALNIKRSLPNVSQKRNQRKEIPLLPF